MKKLFILISLLIIISLNHCSQSSKIIQNNNNKKSQIAKKSKSNGALSIVSITIEFSGKEIEFDSDHYSNIILPYNSGVTSITIAFNSSIERYEESVTSDPYVYCNYYLGDFYYLYIFPYSTLYISSPVSFTAEVNALLDYNTFNFKISPLYLQSVDPTIFKSDESSQQLTMTVTYSVDISDYISQIELLNTFRQNETVYYDSEQLETSTNEVSFKLLNVQGFYGTLNIRSIFINSPLDFQDTSYPITVNKDLKIISITLYGNSSYNRYDKDYDKIIYPKNSVLASIAVELDDVLFEDRTIFKNPEKYNFTTDMNNTKFHIRTNLQNLDEELTFSLNASDNLFTFTLTPFTIDSISPQNFRVEDIKNINLTITLDKNVPSLINSIIILDKDTHEEKYTFDASEITSEEEGKVLKINMGKCENLYGTYYVKLIYNNDYFNYECIFLPIIVNKNLNIQEIKLYNIEANYYDYIDNFDKMLVKKNHLINKIEIYFSDKVFEDRFSLNSTSNYTFDPLFSKEEKNKVTLDTTDKLTDLNEYITFNINASENPLSFSLNSLSLLSIQPTYFIIDDYKKINFSITYSTKMDHLLKSIQFYEIETETIKYNFTSSELIITDNNYQIDLEKAQNLYGTYNIRTIFTIDYLNIYNETDIIVDKVLFINKIISYYVGGYNRTFVNNYTDMLFGSGIPIDYIECHFSDMLISNRLNFSYEPTKVNFSADISEYNNSILVIDTKRTIFTGKYNFYVKASSNNFTFSTVSLELISIEPTDFKFEDRKNLTIKYNYNVQSEIKQINIYDKIRSKIEHTFEEQEMTFDKKDNTVKISLKNINYLYGVYNIMSKFNYEIYDFTDDIDININKNFDVEKIYLYSSYGKFISYNNSFDKMYFPKYNKKLTQIIVKVKDMLLDNRTKLTYDTEKYTFNCNVSFSDNTSYLITPEKEITEITEKMTFKLEYSGNTFNFTIQPIWLDNITPEEFNIENKSDIHLIYSENINELFTGINLIDKFKEKVVLNIPRDKMNISKNKCTINKKYIEDNLYGRYYFESLYSLDGLSFINTNITLIVNKKLNVRYVQLKTSEYEVNYNESFDEMVFHSSEILTEIVIFLDDLLFDDRLSLEYDTTKYKFKFSIDGDDKKKLIINPEDEQFKIISTLEFKLIASNYDYNFTINPLGIDKITPEIILIDQNKSSSLSLYYTCNLPNLYQIGLYNILTQTEDLLVNRENISSPEKGHYVISLKKGDNLYGNYTIRTYFTNKQLDFTDESHTLRVEYYLHIKEIHLDDIKYNETYLNDIGIPEDSKIITMVILFDYDFNESRITFNSTPSYNYSLGAQYITVNLNIAELKENLTFNVEDLLAKTKMEFKVVLLKLNSISPTKFNNKDNNKFTLSYTAKINDLKSIQLINKKGSDVLYTVNAEDITYKENANSKHEYCFTIPKNKVKKSFKIKTVSNYDVITFTDNNPKNMPSVTSHKIRNMVLISACCCIALICVIIFFVCCFCTNTRKRKKMEMEKFEEDALLNINRITNDLGVDRTSEI